MHLCKEPSQVAENTICAENYYTNLRISKQAAGGADTQLGGRALTCIAVQSVQLGTT